MLFPKLLTIFLVTLVVAAEEEDEMDFDISQMTTDAYSTSFGSKCLIASEDEDFLIQDKENKLTTSDNLEDEPKSTWAIRQWNFDDGEFYEIKNLVSEEFISVINKGTVDHDDYEVTTTHFQFLNKNPPNLWNLVKVDDGYEIVHKDTGLHLNLDFDKGSVVLEGKANDTHTHWNVTCN
ncbi:uncharacterized protein LOC132196842 [Neocloeon triangulifer]|uniref:uncharacterized protein LOC132196842 n=1 Tax=Neocloeon triangulifer TaxID=2078957 RepID=UPI00286F3ED1|nr:uncharacterized protein LOC132196842 [Neocloeon triangulifer]